MPRGHSALLARIRRALAAEGFRTRLADPDSLLHFSLLGLLAGVLAGLSIVVFRAIVESTLGALLPGGDPENFEALSPSLRFVLVLGGALLLGLIAQLIPPGWRPVGVAHVIDRFNRHSGSMPKGNLAWQFFGGMLCLITGQAAGREGPTVHIGAAVSSIAGTWLKLPNNSLQILVGCGTAASIAAAFNTPLAGVIFAMEVVMMEYTISGFIPIILSAAAGATVARSIFGETLLFSVAPIQPHSLAEMPAIALLGFAAGTAAALFVVVQARTLRVRSGQPVTRIAVGGLITAFAILGVPEAMGVGYDSLNAALIGQLGLLTLALLAITKLLLSATVSGLGMPIGIIGPTLLIGGCIGGAICKLLGIASPSFHGAESLYVLLGMVAMMGATLNAPMAALTAVMELSGSTSAMLPGMVAVIVANLTCRVLFRQGSTSRNTLEAMGVSIRRNPLRRSLERSGVVSLMDRDVLVLAGELDSPENLQRVQAAGNRWAVFNRDKTHWLADRAALCAVLEDVAAGNPDALAIEFARPCCDVPVQSSLGEAWQRLQDGAMDVACVVEPLALHSVLGIIRREALADAASGGIFD